MRSNHYGPAPCGACKGRGHVQVSAINDAGTMQRSERDACGECHGTGFALSPEDARSPVVRALGDVAWRLRSAGIGDVFGPWEHVEVTPAEPQRRPFEGMARRRKGANRKARGGAR